VSFWGWWWIQVKKRPPNRGSFHFTEQRELWFHKAATLAREKSIPLCQIKKYIKDSDAK